MLMYQVAVFELLGVVVIFVSGLAVAVAQIVVWLFVELVVAAAVVVVAVVAAVVVVAEIAGWQVVKNTVFDLAAWRYFLQNHPECDKIKTI